MKKFKSLSTKSKNPHVVALFTSATLLLHPLQLQAQVDGEPSLDLEEVNVFESIKQGDLDTGKELPSLSTLEEKDDLESLKDDIGDNLFKEETKETTKEAIATDKKIIEKEKEEKQMATKQDGSLNLSEEKKVVIDTKKNENAEIVPDDSLNFDTGNEEKDLLKLSKFVQGKITPKEWGDLNAKSKLEKYEVQKGDYLWKISKKLFGTGFYYSKIWSLNPQITNPHEIEPGTNLIFDLGTTDNIPNVQVGQFQEDEPIITGRKGMNYSTDSEREKPKWLDERKKLIDQGIYFQFASEETYADLERLEKTQRNNEYEKYEPPVNIIAIREPGDEYDASGFDKSSRIVFNYKEGFFLNTFVTTNMLQDLGVVKAAKKESVFIHKFDTVYVEFEKGVKVRPGDLFSVYSAGGEVKHRVSDRAGYQYSITAQLKVIKKIDDVWECMVIDQSGILQRKDRVTVYTPKISKIARTFSRRTIEAAMIGGFRDSPGGISYGDVVYLDRGRADGVELGNIFEVYSFLDRGTNRRITPSPTYKTGELTVINLTDNFATALVSKASNEMAFGNIALTKTQEEAMREVRIKNQESLKDVKRIEGKSLDELDVELNLDDISQDILKKADKIQLTEDELEELERQEREKSIIRDANRDEKELDRLENELNSQEKKLNESKLDEDRLLEDQSLEEEEKKIKDPDVNAFESVNEIERDVGRKYMDEDINNKENPYGLTEFDLEEIDEMLNTGRKK